ncbi:MAG TPA: GNAT family N-acetyltransferase [Amycolatopsis sp.]|nr:GNAT family N-acetyltransferase [Amycolatopsis sp.]
MTAALVVRDPAGATELHDLEALFSRVWGASSPQAPFPLLRALGDTGGMVLGAYLGTGAAARLVGGAVGFRTVTHPHGLRSHIVGVDTGFQGRGIGTAIKLRQRQWCLDRGITEMTWTFDPLVHRNARFNIARLGAVGHAYHPDYYGRMDDDHNAGLPTDRVLLRWSLTREGPAPDPAPGAPVVLAPGPDGAPGPHLAPGGEPEVWLRVPRRIDGPARLAWRHALRAAMRPRLDEGYRWTAVTTDGCYVLQRKSARESE